ncbi:homoserine/homoserine lactone efflux protein [Janthinobacterium sp. CG_23.3]|uniref:LysE family translocator n=1 Tax=unclassified Janthinobacterium TaxID=2610881 RepID=UPI00034C5371|nr:MULTISPECIES: LysE family translocator [unclassified Janthinobacterium]MEC5163312.1 homoserine/homoserine lactone efflux protein [Janthinobacterium sp. CG_S6]
MAFHVWLTFAATYFLLTITPGPNVVLVIRNSLKFGSASALLTILGNLTAQLIVVMLVAGGVGATIAALPEFFLVMKVLGAAYLILLGIGQIRTARQPGSPTGDEAPGAPMSKSGVFRSAFLVSISNPKTLIFLSAFMPQFIDQSRALGWQFAVMYLTIAASVGSVHIFYSFSVNRLKHKVKNSRFIKSVKFLGGSLFVLLGLKLLTSQRT